MTVPGDVAVELSDRECESDPRRDQQLRTSVVEGACSSAMVGFGETYVPAFALAAGLGAVVASLIATVPMMLGAVLQLVTPWGVCKLGSYRRWVICCALLQVASFVPLVVGAVSGEMSLLWLVVASASYWAAGMAAGPAWNVWMSSLVPVGIRAVYFARRTRIAHLTLLAAMLMAGLWLHHGRESGAGSETFAWVFAAAMLARLCSAFFLRCQMEPAGLVAAHRDMPSRSLLSTIRSASAGRAFSYIVGMQFVVNLAGPFFTPLMMGPLGLSYWQFILLTATSFVTRMVVLPCFGRLAHDHGARLLLWLGAIGIVPIPALWLVSHDFTYLLTLQVLSGASWAALELAMVLVFFDGIEAQERTRVLTLFNLVNAGAIGAGAIVGCQLFTALAGDMRAFWWLFVLSSSGRLLMLLVLKVPTSGRRPGFVTLRTLAVRPSAGAIERPIVATLEPASEGDE